MFEKEIEAFIEKQKQAASGLRREQLSKDLTGTKKLLSTVVLPVLKSFEGITLEYEVVSTNGPRIYIDAFYHPLQAALESEGFVAHAENITRERFSFERMRARTLVMYKYKYFPFSWDELDKKPEVCRRAFFELIGRSTRLQTTSEELTIYEQVVIQQAAMLRRPFRNSELCAFLKLSEKPSRGVIRGMIEKELIKPVGEGTLRFHKYVLTSKAIDYLQ